MSVINTNMSSLVSQKNLVNSKNSLNTAMERLSSGMRINSAKDDAAGQAIANRMTSQVRGMAQAQRNANDGVSMVQTMEGGLSRINDNLQRIRELAVQAANDTNTAADRTSISTEIAQRVEEIDRIAANTKFNGIDLLNSTGAMNIQVGANTAGDNAITVNKVSATSGDLGITSLTLATAVSNYATATTAISNIDAAIEKIDTERSTLGAKLNRFDSAIANLQTNETNLSAARSRIEDADYAKEVAAMTRANILQQAGTSVLAQANQGPQTVLSLLR